MSDIAPSPERNPSKWPKGQSGNRRGRPPGSLNKSTLLRQRFAEHRAQDVLDIVFGAAANDPATARWLATRLFGDGRWGATIAPACFETVEECRAAAKRNEDAFFAGSITENECLSINEALARRIMILEHQSHSA